MLTRAQRVCVCPLIYKQPKILFCLVVCCCTSNTTCGNDSLWLSVSLSTRISNWCLGLNTSDTVAESYLNKLCFLGCSISESRKNSHFSVIQDKLLPPHALSFSVLTCTCVGARVCGGERSTLVITPQVPSAMCFKKGCLIANRDLLIRSGWLANGPRSDCLCTLVLMTRYVWILMWPLGVGLRSSALHNKHFTERAIFQVTFLTVLMAKYDPLASFTVSHCDVPTPFPWFSTESWQQCLSRGLLISVLSNISGWLLHM